MLSQRRARRLRGPARPRPDRAAASRLDHPLLLVCTHGKHDPCCARYGRPLYQALAEQADEDWVWQVVARRRRPLRRQPRRPARGPLLRARRRRPTPGRCSTSTSPAGSDLEHYRGRVALLVRRAGGRARGPRGGRPARHRRPRAGRQRRRGASCFRAGGRVYEVAVDARRRRRSRYLTCTSETLRHPRHYAAGILRESAA